LSLRREVLDREVLTLDVAKLPQTFDECAPQICTLRVGQRDITENTYSKDFPWLRARGQRRGENGQGHHKAESSERCYHSPPPQEPS
jgi:hypothetical protein